MRVTVQSRCEIMILKSLFYDKLEVGQMTCMHSFALFCEWNCLSVPTFLIGPSFTNKSFKLSGKKKKQKPTKKGLQSLHSNSQI